MPAVRHPCEDVRCGRPESGGSRRDESLRPPRLATPLPTTAPQTYRRRFPSAFGRYRSRSKSLRHDRQGGSIAPSPSCPDSHSRRTAQDVHCRQETSGILRSVTPANTCAIARGALIPSRVGSLYGPHGSFLLRHCGAPLRTSRSQNAPGPLTELECSPPNSFGNDNHQVASIPRATGPHIVRDVPRPCLDRSGLAGGGRPARRFQVASYR